MKDQSNLEGNERLNQPVITIGFPVYNDEKYVGQAIESILEQTFTHFTLIISNNASTDSTQAICEKYRDLDQRVSLINLPSNIGAGANFRSLLELAKTPFFMWAGGHDHRDPTFLEKLLAPLQKDPSIALAYSGTRITGPDEDILYAETPDRYSYLDDCAYHRASRLITELEWCNMFYGLFRTNVIQACRMDVRSISPDSVILMEVALRGKIYRHPEVLFLRREFRPPIRDREELHRQQLMRVLGKNTIPHRTLYYRYNHLVWEYLRSLFRVFPANRSWKLILVIRVLYRVYSKTFRPRWPIRLLNAIWRLSGRPGGRCSAPPDCKALPRIT